MVTQKANKSTPQVIVRQGNLPTNAPRREGGVLLELHFIGLALFDASQVLALKRSIPRIGHAPLACQETPVCRKRSYSARNQARAAITVGAADVYRLCQPPIEEGWKYEPPSVRMLSELGFPCHNLSVQKWAKPPLSDITSDVHSG